MAGLGQGYTMHCSRQCFAISAGIGVLGLEQLIVSVHLSGWFSCGGQLGAA